MWMLSYLLFDDLMRIFLVFDRIFDAVFWIGLMDSASNSDQLKKIATESKSSSIISRTKNQKHLFFNNLQIYCQILASKVKNSKEVHEWKFKNNWRWFDQVAWYFQIQLLIVYAQFFVYKKSREQSKSKWNVYNGFSFFDFKGKRLEFLFFS